MQASSTAKTAALAHQKRLDVIANNMANVNTYGFKSSSVSFQDTLYTKMVKPTGDQGVNLQRGTGMRVAATTLSFNPGAPIPTGELLDFSIDGEGFFGVRDSQGQTLYTRNGLFCVSDETDGRYLVTAQGYYVLDDQGRRIQLPDGDLSALSVSAEGNMAMGAEQPFAKLSLVRFPNPYGLQSMGNNCFGETVASGGAMASSASIQQGFLEGSNVDMVSEMTNSMIVQRAFSFASRALTTADEMDGLANNLRT